MVDTPEQKQTKVQASAVGDDKPPKKGLVKRSVSRAQALVSWNAIKDNAGAITEGTRGIFSVQKEQHHESFEQAKARLHLSEADILERKQGFLKLAIIMGAFGFMVLLYTVYLLWNHSFGGGMLAFVVCLLCFATACRYHFWYFQVKNHKLGCSMKEWLNAKVGGDK